jgi:hypothetical protein
MPEKVNRATSSVTPPNIISTMSSSKVRDSDNVGKSKIIMARK